MRPALLNCLYILALGWSIVRANSSHADVPGLELDIELHDFPPTESLDKKINLTFAKSCEEFGRFLTQNRGLWGSGPFRTVKCVVAGQEKDPKASTDKPSTDWLLKIHGDKKMKIFEMIWRGDEGQNVSMVSYNIATEVGPLALMSRAKTNALIAYYLASGMPFRSALPKKMFASGKAQIKGPTGPLKNMTPPKELAIFRLNRSDGTWLVEPAGTATLVGENGGVATWRADQLNATDDDPLFAQQLEGRQDLLRQIDGLVKQDASSIFDKFLNLGRSAYVGGRYGAPLRGQGLLSKAPLIGFFGEFRSGFLSGLKMNYDFTPEQKETTEEGSSNFSWSRFQLGYSISRRLSNRFINFIDATPKLGVTSLQLGFSPSETSESLPYEFKITRAPTLGLEIGVESRTNYFLFRGWGFGSYSVGVLPLDKNHTTNSLRAGVDFFRDIMSLGPIRLAGLLFGAVDSTTITKKSVAGEVSTEKDTVSTISLSTIFAGGGLTLTW